MSAARRPPCRDCGKRPAATAVSWYCPACRPKRGRRSIAEAMSEGDRRFLMEHTTRAGKFSWPAGRGPGIPEGEGEA